MPQLCFRVPVEGLTEAT
ncbi:hypothetical protein C368_02324 [Cryptococcus neoformans 125.91]|nr:hypothetical protein C368_02324 [Cryptococcus neoformans var. grubii 125.91]